MDGRAKHMLESNDSQTMTPEIALDAGTRFGQIYHNVAIFRDSDPSSRMILNALASGLLSVGAEVTDAGIISVPAAHAAFNTGYDCILYVGNPDRDGAISGIQAYNPDGTPFTSEQVYEVMKKTDVEYAHYGSVSTIQTYTDANRKYIDQLSSANISSQGYVILDCGCGPMSDLAPNALKSIGADVVAFNTHDPQGKLPRSPGLNKTDLLNISNFVNASIGSIGIAFNGNGTRLALMDESGKYVPGDRLLALLLMYTEPTVAVVPFDSPCVVEEAFLHPLGLRKDRETLIEGRRLIRTKSDINSVISAMKESGAEMGALNDGTFIFSRQGYCPDALYAAALVSELAGKRSIRNVLESIPPYSNRTVRIDFDGNMTRFNYKLREKIKEYDIQEVCTSGEAWKLILKKGSYTIKQSEFDSKKLVVFAESSDVVYLITMMEQARDIITYCI